MHVHNVFMTCGLVTPWWRSRTPRVGSSPGSAEATPILDWRHPLVAALVERVQGDDPVTLLQAAHRLIASEIRPVYSVDDTHPVSKTLRRGRGSCSQRLAVLEAVARASGIPTRVRGLLVDGTFWYPRFPRLKFLVPDRVVLAWPEFQVDRFQSDRFQVDGGWLPVTELFGEALSCDVRGFASGFTNGFTNDGETLFDALARTTIDWDGTGNPGCDLSATVVADLGRFSARDELFDEYGQTLCPGIRILAEPVLSHWRPRARS
jgi:hypothetical protein